LIHPDCRAQSYKQFLTYLSRDRKFGGNFILGAASMLYQVNFIVFPTEGAAIEIKYSPPASPLYLFALDMDILHYEVVDWNKVSTTATKIGRVVKPPDRACVDLQVKTNKVPQVVREKNKAKCKRYRERKKQRSDAVGND
jgi:hypothetical protein